MKITQRKYNNMNSIIPFDVWRLVGAHDAFIWNALVRAISGLHDNTDVSAMKVRHMNFVTHEYENARIDIPALNGRMHTNGEYVQWLSLNETIHIYASNGAIHRGDGLPAIIHRWSENNTESVRRVYAVNGRLSAYAAYTRIPTVSIVTVGYTDDSNEIIRTEELFLHNNAVVWVRRVVGEFPVEIRQNGAHNMDIFSVDVYNLSQYVAGEVKQLPRRQTKYEYETDKYNEALKNVARMISY